MEFLLLVIPLISGGLAGAVANIFVTRRRQRIDAALKLIDYFFSHYGGIAEVKAILKDTSQLSNPVKENLVREIGDWFNLVSFLCEKKYVDTGLLQRVAIFKEIEMFRTLVDSTYASSNALNEAKSWWEHLYGLNLKQLKG